MTKRKFSIERLYKFLRVIVIIVSLVLGSASLGYYLNYMDLDKKMRIEHKEHLKIFPSGLPPKELVDFRGTYPEYNDMDDYTLVGKLASRYPQYIELKKKVEDYHSLIKEKDGEEKSGLKTYTFRFKPSSGALPQWIPASDIVMLDREISFKWINEKPPTLDDIRKMYHQRDRYELNIIDMTKREEGSVQNAKIYLFFALGVLIIFFGGIAFYKYLFPVKK